MIIFWLVVALLGLMAGLYIAHVVATSIVARPTGATKQFKISIAVFALLSAAFLIPTLVIRAAGSYIFDISSPWRLLGIFGYAQMFGAIFFGTCVIYLSVAYHRFRSRDGS